MASIRDVLLHEVAETPVFTNNKITVVGAGQTGMACVINVLCQGVTNEVCILDALEDKAISEMIDMQHGAGFKMNAKITGGTEFSLSACSRVCIIAAGFRRSQDQTRLVLAQRNAEIIKDIVPKLVKYSPNTIICILTTPVDVMTYVAWKVSGFPRNRVFGLGTSIDSVRFRHIMSERLNVAPSSCHAYVIGEHGDSSVAVWSGMYVGGCRLRDLNPKIGIDDDPEKWREIHREVINANYKILSGKGYTNWGVGACLSEIVAAILNNTGTIHPVSTAVMGFYGIEEDIFLSLPCVLTSNGITSVLNLKLAPDEITKLKYSASIMRDVINELSI